MILPARETVVTRTDSAARTWTVEVFDVVGTRLVVVRRLHDVRGPTNPLDSIEARP